MKLNAVLYNLTILIFFAIVILGCKKDEDKELTFSYGQLTDSRDSKTYKTIEIGIQIWMAENLNYEAVSGSWVYGYDLSNAAIYGRLYNWETACSVCPDGWHLPSDSEWTIFTDYLGGVNIAEELKEKGTAHWHSPNTGTNETGFSALPGGYRTLTDKFENLGNTAFFWSSTHEIYSLAWFRALNNDVNNVTQGDDYDFYGYSVRCVKD